MKLTSLFAAVAIMAAGAAQAITYTFDYSVGATDVSGFIETDGTLGNISLAQIVDYEFNLNGPSFGSTVKTLTPGNSFTAQAGSGYYVATPTDLTFNFTSGSIGGVAYYQLGTADNALVCFVTSSLGGCGFGGTQAGQGGIFVSNDWNGNGIYETSNQTGAQDLGAVVPLPAGLPLLATGLLGVALIGRRFAKSRV